ncbi:MULTISPECIES: cobalt-precorrin-5B (C(1))-methyltransferase [unclassified Parafrankia]|uniref:cobalt-precorrin-5B (C(1))-methyltransferase n=1 Tax=unclassified Parafrankia TaxID=2994368 RepID=UPI000DA48FB6|nr:MULTISPECIES: cobalt-precorrin-5B (C(1))-methyltransferase [unclassified Parafrankia]TCJ33791.1 cobalt-precorrin-5B (C(1))-methyltransferase [Parafrankia sp. BMG5.11]SQD96660.1 putative cobalt-precorrin-6A synthase (deacetylating) [Parafrankia sp. Ea1.12]
METEPAPDPVPGAEGAPTPASAPGLESRGASAPGTAGERSGRRSGADRGTLRYGWTTGACATAAATAAYTALLTGEFPDPVTITLPGGARPAFALAREWLGPDSATAAVIKDAGDDPDVTHGAVVTASIRRGSPGTGVVFRAGVGVGTVTRPGLPLAVGEPAINPVPRRMMRAAVAEVAAAHGDGPAHTAGTTARASTAAVVDVEIEIGVDGGAELATRTWNPRLGILGGLSILGTTGIVVPYSCSAWIDSIRRGIDVARAAGHRHVAACTGSTSEQVARDRYGLPDEALLDMGDFAGAVLKYLRRHPIPRLTVVGGVGKLAKLAAGHLDLHSGRSQVDLAGLAALARSAGAGADLQAAILGANTALGALRICADAGIALGDLIAAGARRTACEVLREAPVTVDALVIDRVGVVVGYSDGTC